MTKIQISYKWSDVKPSGRYVYIHRKRSDMSVFYVGKGTGNRAWRHVGRNKYWINTIKKHGFCVEVVQDNMSEEDAFLLEMWLIAKFRHEGVSLTNISDGGEGGGGFESPFRRAVRCSNGMSFKSLDSACKWVRGKGNSLAHPTGIYACCSGRNNSAYGFSWWYEGEDPKEYISKESRLLLYTAKPVRRSDGAEFLSLQKAANSVKDKYPKASPVNISKVAHGDRPVAYGYGWTFM